MSDAYEMSTVLLVSVDVWRSMDGSMGDETALPDVMSEWHVMVLMNDGYDMLIVPRSQSHVILIPSRWSGLLRSCMSKLPPISLTTHSIDLVQLVTTIPSLMYHLTISTLSSLKQKKTIMSASLGLNANFSISHFSVWCQT